MSKSMLLLMLLFSLVFVSCGGDEGNPGDFDNTCYDCESVCEGTTGDVADECTTKCDECQGYSDCFGWMDAHYEGMTSEMKDWTATGCEPDNASTGTF